MGRMRRWQRLTLTSLLGCLLGLWVGWANTVPARAIPISTEIEPGFHTCRAPSTSDMLNWWTNSPYYWVGVYIGGINATCPPGTQNPNLTNAWIAAVTGTTPPQNQHWDLAPIYVGLQAPCPNPTSPPFSYFSYDPQTAWNQGVAAAQDAISQYAGPILQFATPPT